MKNTDTIVNDKIKDMPVEFQQSRDGSTHIECIPGLKATRWTSGALQEARSLGLTAAKKGSGYLIYEDNYNVSSDGQLLYNEMPIFVERQEHYDARKAADKAKAENALAIVMPDTNIAVVTMSNTK